ncbi:DDB1- and CUL4-associated factor 10 homolog [Drosophila sulfurigaster albostrigata]|uniref:DDB1- and CUL4-associated factor 10 homolog n=1 Tax=Drosophila sulfurigaster albostrigata TaxID=89887 RepID=UPI002D21B843|nr:DDB1- and CUL4-associated factor 10 homolog [Drosophila sulfurigaster albostrigata]
MHTMEQYLRSRESGWQQHNRHAGNENFLMRSIYSSMGMFNSYHANCTPSTAGRDTGAIFNLEYNADGNVVVAATQRKCVLVFDAITQEEIFKVPDAHTDSVNCIKFFDDRKFATGSDDFTVALWDLRNMKQKLRVLHGHSNWVKNIEYSSKEKLLVTSGFDGSIFTWDIKSQTEQGLISQRVFHASGLMRCRISPAGDKLVLCTSGGYIMIVHHLDLTTLHKDLCGFRPGIYRLMQLGEQFIPQAAKYDHVFSKRQKKNRVELVTDFPEQNDAEMIMALQIHPQCRCMLTRNVSCDEQSEWTCIHDINEEPEVTEDETGDEPTIKRKRPLPPPRPSESERGVQQGFQIARPQLRRYMRAHPARIVATSPPAAGGATDNFIPDIWAAEVTVQERAIRQSRARNSANHVSGYNFVYAISSGVLPLRSNVGNRPNSGSARTRAAQTEASNGESTSASRSNNNSNGSSSSDSNSSTSNNSSSNDSNDVTESLELGQRIPMRPLSNTSAAAITTASEMGSHEILVNARKLLYYASETNNKPGFIKEPGFSADGRIICSPYANGVRLLGYQADCSDYPNDQMVDQIKDKPRQLVELANIIEHQDVVLCAKFSPREPLLVTGCNQGEVAWYRPYL